jgi:HAD superfamily hydrolase (TIGR01450 family)
MDDLFLANLRLPSNVVFDLDGVVFLGGDTIPGSGEALSAIAARGTRIVFATNNATRTTGYIAARIETGTGYTPGVDAIATSAAAALGPDDDPILVIGEAGLLETLATAGRIITNQAAAATTVIVGLDREVTYDKLERASTAIRGGARFVATNTDVTFPTPGGPVPGAGTIVAAVAAASGREPDVMGKPHPAMVRHVEALLADGDTWMVGDRPETDLALARIAGWTAVLTLTGITTDRAEVAPEYGPDLVIESIADLIDVFAQSRDVAATPPPAVFARSSRRSGKATMIPNRKPAT